MPIIARWNKDCCHEVIFEVRVPCSFCNLDVEEPVTLEFQSWAEAITCAYAIAKCETADYQKVVIEDKTVN
jgi:hypothetical protein